MCRLVGFDACMCLFSLFCFVYLILAGCIGSLSVLFYFCGVFGYFVC